jgi:hypothetical protein
MDANKTQVGGEHYRSGFQHWDFVVALLHCRYFEGQITKYVARWRKKNGVQDLEKALHYTHKLVELFIAGKVQPMPRLVELAPVRGKLGEFFEANGITGTLERYIFISITEWQDLESLLAIEAWVEELIHIEGSDEFNIPVKKDPPLIRDALDVDFDPSN